MEVCERLHRLGLIGERVRWSLDAGLRGRGAEQGADTQPKDEAAEEISRLMPVHHFNEIKNEL